jgi:hypothetical protein
MYNIAIGQRRKSIAITKYERLTALSSLTIPFTIPGTIGTASVVGEAANIAITNRRINITIS